MRNLKNLTWLLVALFFSASPLTSQTITNPRTPAEFEEVQGVVICWFEEQYLTIFAIAEEYGWTPLLLEQYQGLMNTQTTLVQEALNEGVEVYVLDDTSHNQVWGKYYSDYHVADTLSALGLSSPLLHVIPEVGQNSPWARDWGPYSVYQNRKDLLYLAGRGFNQTIADYMNYPFLETDIMDGGNYLTDGHGNLFCDAKQPNISLDTFGFTDSLQIANYKVHIDYYLKMINEETFIINEIPYTNYLPPFDNFFGDSAVLDSVVDRISQKSSCYGRPYKFIRIKTAPTSDSNNVTVFTSEASYANSLILNRTVLVPQYQHSVATDTTALNIYKQNMPGYRIVGLPARQFAGMGGTIHCITREIAAEEPIFISHAWYPDTVNQTTDYQINALIQTRSGVANAVVHWTTDTTLGFQTFAMTNTAGDSFTASIPGQAYGTRVFYYLEAVANSNKTGRQPLVAPAWVYNFLVFEPGACQAVPGDVNGTPPIGLPDVIHLVNYVFDKDRPATSCLGADPGNCWTPDPLCRGEVNGTSPIGLPDVVHLVNYVFDKDRPATSCLGSSPGNCWTPVPGGVCCLQ
jgi:hypothetical protein